MEWRELFHGATAKAAAAVAAMAVAFRIYLQ